MQDGILPVQAESLPYRLSQFMQERHIAFVGAAHSLLTANVIKEIVGGDKQVVAGRQQCSWDLKIGSTWKRRVS